MFAITNKQEKKQRFSAFDINDIQDRFSHKLILAQGKANSNKFGGTRGRSFDYTQSQVRQLIKDYKSEKSQTALREISQALFVQSPQYQRLVNYYASMPTYNYAIVPHKGLEGISEDKIAKDYYKLAEFLSNFDIAYNFTQVVRKAIIADIFFGYVFYDKKTVMIQQFPNDICKISSMENGSYNFSINMGYFESNEDLLEYYPNEVQIAFKQYRIKKNNKKNRSVTNDTWVELSAKNTICIKINEGITEAVPMFSGVFDSIYDINAFKDLRNDKAELENYKLLVQKLPIRKDSNENNDFLIDMQMMDYFHNAVADTAPENVGVATTPMDIDVVTFDKDSADRDGVAKATKDFWDSSGTTQNLFSSDNKTSQGINKSIETDEQVIFTILKQIQRWINRHISLNNYSKYFKCVMIEVTHFSKEAVIKRYIENSQYGFPVKSFLSSLLGVEPISFANMAILENDVLKLHENMIPLKSSFNTSAEEIDKDVSKEEEENGIEDDGGRPTNEDIGVEDADETARGRDKADSTE